MYITKNSNIVYKVNDRKKIKLRTFHDNLQKVNRSHFRSISQCRKIIYNVMKVFSCNDFDREACRFQFISYVHVPFNVFYIISAPHPLSFKITWFSRTHSIQLHDTLIRSVFKH